jgi:hypothetical protein
MAKRSLLSERPTYILQKGRKLENNDQLPRHQVLLVFGK